MSRAGLIATETNDEAKQNVDAAVAELAKAGVKAHGVARNTIYGYAAREIVADARAPRRGRHHHGLARPQ